MKAKAHLANNKAVAKESSIEFLSPRGYRNGEVAKAQLNGVDDVTSGPKILKYPSLVPAGLRSAIR